MTRGDFSSIKSEAGGGRVLAVMAFLRSNAAPLYRYRGSQSFKRFCRPSSIAAAYEVLAGTVVTADHAVKTRDGWKRVRDTGVLSA